MKIHFKAGGGAMPPFIAYTPFISSEQSQETTTETSSTTKKTKDDSKDDSIGIKDIIDLMKNSDILPSDRQALEYLIQDFKNLASLNSSNFQSSIFSEGMTSRYFDILQKLQIATKNSKEYDSVYKDLEEKDAINEYAVTNNNGIIVYNTVSKKLDVIPIDKYMPNQEQYNSEGYVPMTVNDILVLRMRSPEYAFNDELLNLIKGTKGISEISKNLKSLLSELGSKTFDISYDSNKNNIANGAQMLMELAKKGVPINMAGEGRYQSKDSIEQINSALSSLYNSLSNKDKGVLAMRSNNTKKPFEGAATMVYNMIASRADSSQIIDFSEGASKSKGGKNGFNDIKYNNVAQFLFGVGHHERFKIQDGTNDGLLLDSTSAQVTSGKSPIEDTSLHGIMSSDYSTILDISNATLGGLLLDTNDSKKIITDGTIHQVVMPIDQEAESNGVIKPDLKFLQKKKLVDDEIKRKGIHNKNYDAINKIYEQKKMPCKYDSNGELVFDIKTKSARFAVFNGYAFNSSFGNTDESELITNDYLQEVTGTALENIISRFKDLDFDHESAWDSVMPFWNSHDSVYKGAIFIPMKENAIAAMTTGNDLSADQMNDLEALEQQKELKKSGVIEQMYKNGLEM